VKLLTRVSDTHHRLAEKHWLISEALTFLGTVRFFLHTAVLLCDITVFVSAALALISIVMVVHLHDTISAFGTFAR